MASLGRLDRDGQLAGGVSALRLPRPLLRALIPAHQRLLRRVHDLTYLFVELTQRCNIECLHCGSDCGRDPGGDELPAQAVLRALGEIRDRYDAGRIMVVLSGGEPLCYPDVFGLAAQIRDLGFRWGMVSNGFGWTREKVDSARDAGMSAVTISLDGTEADHDWLRGRAGSYRRAVRTIRMLQEPRFTRTMDIISCINRRNIGRLDEMYRQVLDLGVPAWRLFAIQPIGRAPQEPELFLEPHEFRRLMAKITDYRRRGEIGVQYAESGYLGPHLELEVRDQHHHCTAGVHVAGIMANGDLLACPNIDRRFRQGNIHHDSFVQIWEHEYKPFRDRAWMKTGECASCAEWRVCGGSAFHLRDPESGRTHLCHCHEYGLLPGQV